MDRSRRRPGCWIALASVLVLGVIVWVLLPRLVCVVANASLPRELGPQATLLALEPALHRTSPAPIRMQVDPILMRRIAADASGRWIPPGVIRHGLGAVGTVRGAGNVAVAWQAVAIDGAVPPRLAVSLSPEQANAMLTSEHGNTLAGMQVAVLLNSVELSAMPDDGTTRHFRIEAAGALRLTGGPLSVSITVRRLSAGLTVVFTPAGTGWEPDISLQIDALEAPLPPIPGVDAASWRHMLGAWAEERISAEIGDRTLPAWFPTDLQVSLVVR